MIRHAFELTLIPLLATVAIIGTPPHTLPILFAAATHCAVVVAQAAVLLLGVAAVGAGLVVGRVRS